MIRDYQDLAMTFDPESEDAPRIKAPPKLPQSRTWVRRVFPSRRLILILLGLSFILTITIMVFGVKGHFYNAQLKETQDSLNSFNQTIGKQFTNLQDKGINLADLSRNKDSVAKVSELEGKVKKLTQENDEAIAHLFNQMKALRKSNLALNCDFQDFKLNRTVRTEACCPKGWNAFRKSCYWESRQEKSWQEAKAECENHDAHLVIITSYEEQQFVAVRVKPHFVWIGLTDADGSWKWVDGSPYTVVSRDWCPDQPDNWYDHGLGGREDCAHLHSNGCWNDAHCTRAYGFVCEMETEI
ncbi:asialoglycoprotein receptor 1 [Protobothrops mucrosquamatus]|uniref:asialoglycoprotein receptor 1 n=1 Tax=Protobothrops mucrosquamatus TaxID=103944 RepID=UPI0010FB78BE|nr:asialoglycoprotein receptor 1 [Protobothrops mucrosquamatus]